MVVGAVIGGRSVIAQTNYFKSVKYTPTPLPVFEDTKAKLPSPIFDEKPLYVRMYWKTWQIAFCNFHKPAPQSGFVSQFIDAAYNEDIFLYDTCFMTMFCDYAHPLVPGIGSLDNFYAKQHGDGEICRQINRTSGIDCGSWVNRERRNLFSRHNKFSVTYVDREIPQPPPVLTLDALNHPILTWAEQESLRMTGDRGRVRTIYEPLVRYYRALQKYIRQGNGLYMTDWASMDNSPRNVYLAKGGTAVDTSSQMVLFATDLAEFADLLGKKKEAGAFRAEADQVAKLINDKMWNPQRKFYFDLTVQGKQAPAKTIAAYWTLLAGVAAPKQADALAGELRNPKSFARHHRVPTTPADQKGFDPRGGAFRGAVWAPKNTMVIRGLEKYDKHKLAREIALEHLRIVGEVFQNTGTIWENYAPDSAKPGSRAKRDFVGWSGIGPILYFIEYAIGIKADAAANELVWDITSSRRVGVEKFRFGGKTVSLVCGPADNSGRRTVKVSSDKPFVLVVHWKGKQTRIEVPAGKEIAQQLGRSRGQL